jgi:hypothetical protein
VFEGASLAEGILLYAFPSEPTYFLLVTETMKSPTLTTPVLAMCHACRWDAKLGVSIENDAQNRLFFF